MKDGHWLPFVLASIIALAFVFLAGCSDDAKFDKKITEAQQRQVDYCKVNPVECKVYCEKAPDEPSCKK